MTVEEYSLIEPLRGKLDAAATIHSVRLLPEEKSAIIKAYESMSGRRLTVSEKTCSSCMLRVCRYLRDALLKT